MAHALLPGGANAQVRGMVRGEAGQPIEGAVVELWTSTQHVGTSISDAAGRFLVPSPAPSDVLALYVRRIGFAPVRFGPVSGSAAYTVTLRALSVSLPQMVVHAGPPCPIRDDPRARRAWETARSHYRPLRPGLALVAELGGTVSDHVAEDSIAVYDTSRTWSGGDFMTNSRGEGGLARFRSEGYASRTRPGFRGAEDRGLWGYALLEQYESNHFSENVFGELHDFGFIEESAETIRLRFCPHTESHRPEIIGTLTFAGDTSFAAAEWRFTTPAPDENAGGQLFFAPLGGPDSLLLPMRGIFWRRLGRSGRYYQRIWDYSQWTTRPRS